MKSKLLKYLLKHILKATSLIETVVALVMIMSVFSIGMMVYFNVIKSSYSLQQLKASLMLNELSKVTKEKKSFFDEQDSTETLVIYKRISKYENMENLVLLELEVLSKDSTKLASRRELVELDENE